MTMSRSSSGSVVTGAPASAKPSPSRVLRQMVGALALNAGIRSTVNPYVLRHSACRWLLMSGQSAIVVEKILGHGSEAMIREHYNELGTDDAHDRLMRVLRAERS